ncbi:hypothetical protein GF420_07480 [candidate division GN15 bacterium]|nr:hypothetical protein [candidate division GN15 bacterium]
MDDQHTRAELMDRIYTMAAAAALPFAAIMVLDSLQTGAGETTLITGLGWAAKAVMLIVILRGLFLMVRKWRTRVSHTEEPESYSGGVLLKAAGISWLATIVVLLQSHRIFRSDGILGITELPSTQSGDLTAAFMLVVFSLTYFTMNLSTRWAEARDTAS